MGERRAHVLIGGTEYAWTRRECSDVIGRIVASLKAAGMAAGDDTLEVYANAMSAVAVRILVRQVTDAGVLVPLAERAALQDARNAYEAALYGEPVVSAKGRRTPHATNTKEDDRG